MSQNQNPVLKWFTQNHVRTYKGSATTFGWDCPLLTFIYPGFDCVSGGPSGWVRLAATFFCSFCATWGFLRLSWKVVFRKGARPPSLACFRTGFWAESIGCVFCLGTHKQIAAFSWGHVNRNTQNGKKRGKPVDLLLRKVGVKIKICWDRNQGRSFWPKSTVQ